MAGNGNRKVVVDASVILAWLLPDEAVVEKVDEIMDKSVRGEVDLVAPLLLVFEVWSGIRNSVLRGRIELSMAEKLIKRFAEVRIEYIHEEINGIKVIQKAIRRNLSVYNACYVVLAENMDCELLTLDKRMV